ncbi:hypothetical protein EVAR_41541_1 [Eumeta japonica]|uniref:Uncharacterized protein n=1 Tax=Eumeta variegata TaxID=151549 RepID=A0A4C1X2F3_EUMVA|nr:hypothetical protein EVAR_41541_1 [Eumeta japonica]
MTHYILPAAQRGCRTLRSLRWVDMMASQGAGMIQTHAFMHHDPSLYKRTPKEIREMLAKKSQIIIKDRERKRFMSKINKSKYYAAKKDEQKDRILNMKRDDIRLPSEYDIRHPRRPPIKEEWNTGDNIIRE